MIIRKAGYAALFAAIVLAACQSYEMQPQRSFVDGTWTSSDGFASTFRGGSFNTRFLETSEVVAQGTYSVTGSTVTMRWLSLQAQQQRAATCTLTSASTMQCQQQGGGGFELIRAAA
jgi:hypothetical protein